MKTFLTLLLTVCIGQTMTKGNSPVINPEGDVWQTYTQPAFSIQYPPRWDLDKSGQMGTSFFLFSPLETEQDKFKENVNLIIQDLPDKSIDLDKYTEISENQIKTLITNSTLVESKRVKNKSGEHHKIIYTGEQGVLHLKYEQYYWVVGGKAYVLTFTSEQNKFDSFKDAGERILNSFELK